MNTCLSTLAKITGQHSTVIRVPYGSKPYMTTNYRKAMDAKGYQMWDWNVDSLDWKLLNGPKTANYTINQIKAIQKSGTSPLILFHDKATTADALPAVLSYLKENGYELLPITNEIEQDITSGIGGRFKRVVVDGGLNVDSFKIAEKLNVK